MMFWNCRKCEAYKEQIAYLQKLIDNLLENKGIAPIIQEEVELEDTEEEKRMKELKSKGAIIYGEG